MLFEVIPESLIKKKNESELIVYFKNGSLLQLQGADNPDRLRGANPIGVVLDEFATMKEETWSQIVEPIMRGNGGWCWFVGTPKGKNHLYKYYVYGQQGHREWKSWLLTATDSGIIPEDQLKETRLTSTQSTYNQEYLCEFLEGEGSVFRGVREVCTASPQKAMQGHYYVMGVDLAKVQDYTVICVYDRKTNEQVYQDRFQTLEWPFQKKRIAEICRTYNRALIILDATGIGDPIADDLLRAGLPVEPYKITNESKKEMIEKLSIWIDQRRVKMLSTQETLYEFDNFSYDITSSGRILYGAKEGFHDDIVIAQSLAVWGLQPLIPQVPHRDPTVIQTAKMRELRKLKDIEREYEPI